MKIVRIKNRPQKRHIKMRGEAMKKAFSKSRPSCNRNIGDLCGTLQYAFTKKRKFHTPEIKEVSRYKI